MARALRFLCGLCGFVLLALPACSGGSASPPGPAAAAVTATEPSDEGLPRPTLRLLVATDFDGNLEPCGCQQRPLGGLDRLATELARAKADGVPTLFLHAGDLLFDGLDHGVRGADASTQEVWKAETMVDALSRLGLAATTAGPLDATQGVDTLRRLAGTARFPFLATGATFGGAPLHTEPVLRELAGLKIGVFGVSELETPSGTVPDGLAATADARTAARAETTRLRAAGADLVIGLARASRRTARSIAMGTPGLDFLVEGGLAESEPIVPTRSGDAVLLHAGRNGMGLLVVEVYRRGAGAFTDVGAWTRTRERARLAESATALQARIAEWERAGQAGADVDAQKARLAELERQRAALAPRPTARGNAFAARYVELDATVPRDPAIRQVLDAYNERVNEHNRTAFADLLPRDPAPGQPRYVGARGCQTCHSEEYEWWRTTPHGHAYATLTNVHREFNLSCVGCHVTGYNEPGGSTVTHNTGLVDVGCESCHGPGSAHSDDPAVAMARVDVPATICLGCHTPEHSDAFNYAHYRTELIAPGHGQ
jgi:2',3'-cyclic-nucleotide 2'-phosphodiesterase (5'-nucleotidase family)